MTCVVWEEHTTATQLTLFTKTFTIMKHEDYKVRYNEIMCEERDMIKNFLKEQADIRYGNQMYEWAIEPSISLVGWNGGKIDVSGIMLLNDEVFVDERGAEISHDVCEFAYGELSKIIDVLPNASEIVRRNCMADFKVWCDAYRLTFDKPFAWTDGNSRFEVHSISKDNDGNVDFEIKETINGTNGWGLWNELPDNVIKDLRDYTNEQILKWSNEYKALCKQLSKMSNMCYNFVENGNAGSIYITPNGTDLQLDVLDVCCEIDGLNILVSVVDTGLDNGEESITLKEKDLTPANLAALVEFFKRDEEIMDTYNSHNPALVEKINKAWNNEDYKSNMGTILLAILTRDIFEYEEKFGTAILTEEFALDNAHNILENVCDDWDLECVLSFIRYK